MRSRSRANARPTAVVSDPRRAGGWTAVHRPERSWRRSLALERWQRAGFLSCPGGGFPQPRQTQPQWGRIPHHRPRFSPVYTLLKRLAGRFALTLPLVGRRPASPRTCVCLFNRGHRKSGPRQSDALDARSFEGRSARDDYAAAPRGQPDSPSAQQGRLVPSALQMEFEPPNRHQRRSERQGQSTAAFPGA